MLVLVVMSVYMLWGENWFDMVQVIISLVMSTWFYNQPMKALGMRSKKLA